jgi:predicted metalloprotease with PDZ domain
MVSGNDPLWRGGLSGPNSFFFHSSRRAISQNGTSPLFHELVHVVSNIHGADQDDWIAEGIAEYYGIELLYRAGGYDEATRDTIYADLAEWAEDAEQLRLDESTGPVTARAVLVFDALDREIRMLTDNRASLDEVTRQLMTRRWVALADLQGIVQGVTGLPSKVLDRIE